MCDRSAVHHDLNLQRPFTQGLASSADIKWCRTVAELRSYSTVARAMSDVQLSVDVCEGFLIIFGHQRYLLESKFGCCIDMAGVLRRRRVRSPVAQSTMLGNPLGRSVVMPSAPQRRGSMMGTRVCRWPQRRPRPQTFRSVTLSGMTALPRNRCRNIIHLFKLSARIAPARFAPPVYWHWG